MSGTTTGGPDVHLLPAGELFWEGYPSTLVAACGEPVTSEPDSEPDSRYCSDCVHAALRWRAQPAAGER